MDRIPSPWKQDPKLVVENCLKEFNPNLSVIEIIIEGYDKQVLVRSAISETGFYSKRMRSLFINRSVNYLLPTCLMFLWYFLCVTVRHLLLMDALILNSEGDRWVVISSQSFL